MTFTRMASHKAITVTLAVVALLVVALTLFKGELSLGGLWSTSAHAGHRSLNLQPFYSWQHYSVWWGPWTNTIGNIVMFVPLSFLITGWLNQRSSTRHPAVWAVVIGIGLSLCIEVAQFALAVGYSDVDDLMFNSVGAVVGAVLFIRLGARKRGMVTAFSLLGSVLVLALMLASSTYLLD